MSRSRLLSNNILGHCFYGYTGRPLFRQNCDDENCTQRSIPKISVLYSFPHWLIKQAVGICFQREAHPQFSISLIRVIPPESEIFRYIRTGDCDQLGKLLNSGKASAADIGAFTGMSVLTYAVSHYQVEVCKLLIAHSAKPFAPNPSTLAPSAGDLAWNIMHEYSTPRELQTALSSIFPQPDLDSRQFSTLQRLILNLEYSSIDIALRQSRPIINHRDSAGRTALHWAAWTGNADILQRVLKCGAEINTRDNAGRCALHFAAQNGSVDCVRELLDSGANVNVRDNWGETPLHLAGSDSRNESVSLLLEAGADVNARTGREESCLCYATLANNVDGIKLLLAGGADLESQDNIGYTVLLDCIWANAHEVAQALIEAGADTSVKGTDGKGLLHAAAMYADVRMCEILGRADTAELDPYAKMKDGMNAWEQLRARIGLGSIAGAGLDSANIRGKEKAKDLELIEAFGALALSTARQVDPRIKKGSKRRDDGEEVSSKRAKRG
ncbi:uncharacterized protein A1O9_08825 [Exophiala aquamarina CBS 119918]|uniref:Uncharacterized protein n=1 Tax=Exophiala aquamarina CBS 119918 TaxID=1182545 RepID=A0A072P5P9_9EURO|nr:uncharacterized protein A1O9_08825 [Exophiala aquamarina CBS 119918]KEF55171.1 hypothetical protein A1O9_08825 [Exophiala aquamarina CBS 119918]